MKGITRHRQSLVAMIRVVMGLMILTTASLQADSNPNPGVLPPNSRPHGLTYGEWSARWWQWALALPADHHPLTDTADCSTGQLGPVWFLGGVFNVSGTANRNCTVPVGKALFFPIINADCSNLEAPPFFGATEADRRACVTSVINSTGGLSCEVDGVSLQNLTNYRSPSPNFHFTVPPNNLLGVAAGSGEAVTDGFYLMLAPLSVGQHTIHFSGTFIDFGFTLDITYHLTVAP